MLGNFPLGNFALGGWLLISNLVGIKFWQNGPGFEIGDLLRAQQVDYDKDHNPVGVYSIDAEVVEIRSGQKMVLEIVSGKEFLTNALKGQLEFVRLGNRLNTDRQGSVMIASQPAHVGVIDGIDEFSKWGTLAAYKGVFGKLDWINDANFGQLSGWGGYTTNFYLKGKIAGGSASALMTGTGYWFEKEGSGRLGNPATNKYIKFDVSTGIVELGSAVALSWAAVTGAGKPADNATVGADWGSNVTGRPTNLVALGDVPGYIQSTYIDSTEIKAPNITGNSILGGNIVASSGGTNTAGLTGEGSGDSAVRIWAGSTYANRASAPFRVTQGGDVFTNNLTAVGDFKTAVSGTRVEIRKAPNNDLRFWFDTTIVGGIIPSSDSGIEVWANDGLVLSATESVTIEAGTDTLIVGSGFSYNSHAVWHAGNDGPNSGLDADLLDGSHASAFLGATAQAVDSDKLDGSHASAFLTKAGGASGTINFATPPTSITFTEGKLTNIT